MFDGLTALGIGGTLLEPFARLDSSHSAIAGAETSLFLIYRFRQCQEKSHSGGLLQPRRQGKGSVGLEGGGDGGDGGDGVREWGMGGGVSYPVCLPRPVRLWVYSRPQYFVLVLLFPNYLLNLIPGADRPLCAVGAVFYGVFVELVVYRGLSRSRVVNLRGR